MISSSFKKKIGNYKLKTEIGRGSFATVYKGELEDTNEIVAIKMMSKMNVDNEKIQIIEKEIEILNSLDHPNIIKLRDLRKTKNNWYLIFEYCDLGDLENYIKKYFYNEKLNRCIVPEDAAQKIVQQICEALKVMRKKSIVHRDLKLANILITKDYVIKVADFGFAKFADDNFLLKSYCGTPVTMAPEILKKNEYNEKCDIYSLGLN